MSEKKYAEDDPERTLLTLDQLSQTIAVMTSVVNRLRRHLNDQIKAQLNGQESETGLASQQADPLNLTTDLPKAGAAQADETAITVAQQEPKQAQQDGKKKKGFVVEMNQQEIEPAHKATKVLH